MSSGGGNLHAFGAVGVVGVVGGNRRLNAVLDRSVLTQAHASTDASTYLARRQQDGKTKREAMRALKRYVVRAIWRLWVRCYPEQLRSISTVAAWSVTHKSV